ncbi:MAG TPA: prepilin-type N-terminal cleavage/methylation domain-containing protein [Gemmataceae bacterium]|nr:prepilin-type N-terminal cleavage/methylation domain-containing protein [Gemmataceae bacterium]
MRQRKGFTLVEMMVAMALTLFIMVILSQAFVAALETFRQLKAIGDMEERLRSVSTLLRRELAADHFEGRKRLSNPGFFNGGPPREGFFRIFQGSATAVAGPANFWEGYDSDGIGSTRATDHLLHFTVKLRGNNPQDVFTASIGSASLLNGYQPPIDSRYQSSGNYNSQWAEVAYFLRANGDTTSGAPGVGTPLFSLYRRQRLLVPLNSGVTDSTDTTGTYPVNVYANVSCSEPLVASPGPPPYYPVYFNSPNDITIPERRFAMSNNAGTTQPPPPPITIANGRYPILADNASITTPGADLLLTDVISFDIRFMIPQSATPRALPSPPYPAGSYLDSFIDLYDSEALYQGMAALGVLTSNNSALPPPPVPPATVGVPKVFDTWSSVNDGVYNYTTWAAPGSPQSLPLPLTIQAIKITLRIWDKKTQRTRQVSFIQDM